MSRKIQVCFWVEVEDIPAPKQPKTVMGTERNPFPSFQAVTPEALMAVAADRYKK